MKKVYGVGTYTVGKYPSSVKAKHTREYLHWTRMLRRVMCKSYHKTHPTYKDCTVSENFKNFQYFAEWCNQQIGWGETDWELDKDLLGADGVYSEDTCCFVPRIINSLTNSKRKAVRGDYPLGVSLDDRPGREPKFYSKVNDTAGGVLYLGSFNTAEAAFCAYKKKKEELIKNVAEEYKSRLDPKVYQKLLSYEINIED